MKLILFILLGQSCYKAMSSCAVVIYLYISSHSFTDLCYDLYIVIVPIHNLDFVDFSKAEHFMCSKTGP